MWQVLVHVNPGRFHVSYRTRRMVPRFVSRNGFRPFIWNCGAALSRRASRASWSGRLLDDASDQYRRPASHWPLLLGAVENRPGDDGQEEAGGCLQEGQGEEEDGSKGVSRADHPSSILPQPPAILCNRFTLQRACHATPTATVSSSFLATVRFPQSTRHSLTRDIFSEARYLFADVETFFSSVRTLNDFYSPTLFLHACQLFSRT